MNIDKYFLGAIPSPEDNRDYNIAMLTPVQKTFPKEFKIKYPGKIKNQGDIGSCVAFSLSYTRELQEYEQSKEFKRFSEGFIYGNRADTLGELLGREGMIPRDALRNLRIYGNVLYEDFPHNDKYPIVKKIIEENKDGLYKKAEPYKISTYVRLNTVEEIKTALMELGAVTAMFPIYKSFYKTNKYNPICPIPDVGKEKLQGYHEMTILGWREDNTWIVLNSWGEDWADSGHCYVSFDFPIQESWSITDMILPHYAEKYFYWLNKNNLFIDERRFDDKVTRGEFFALISRYLGYKEGDNMSENQHWAQKYFDFLNTNGVKVYETRFDEEITRGEIFALIARLKGYKE